MARAKEVVPVSHKVLACAVILNLVLIIQSIAAAKISTSPSWTIINNPTGEYGVIGQAKFRYLENGGSRVQSENQSFCLGFLHYEESSLSTLSIVMMGKNGENGDIGMQVWSANRDNLVRDGAILSVNKNGNLELLDSNKTLVWSPQIQEAQKVAAMELLDTGNLVLYDSNNNRLWQSFDHPTNVLLPGQSLTLGMRLVSNLTSSDGSSGHYSLVLEQNGITLYENLGNSGPTPYSRWSFWSQNVKRPCSLYQAVLVYNMSGAYLQAVNSTGLNRNNSQVCLPLQQTSWLIYDDSSYGSQCSGTCQRFMRLENDGNWGSYVYLNKSQRWNTPPPLFSSCQLPSSCGSYGLCSKGGQCICPNPREKDWFCFTNPSVPSQGCIAQTNLTCHSRLQKMVEIKGLSYIPNNLLGPLQGIPSSADCAHSCLMNCSCVAAFFADYSRSCHHVANIRTLYETGKDLDLVYLKVQEQAKSKKSLIIGASMGLTIVILFCLVLLISLRIRHIRKKRTAALSEREETLKGLAGLPPRFSSKQLQKATKGFSTKLGKGGFGAVYEGTLPDGKLVAVKKIESSTYALKQFLAEVATLGSISHINLVRLCGFCLDDIHHMLVYEIMPNSSLDKWLFREDKKTLGWDTRYRIALGTARGLAYLHEDCRDPIIHLDIKPQNILLDHDFTAKVADFGLSRLVERDKSYLITKIGGTPGYIAPEAILHSIVTKRCDVYSFGIVLLELVAGRRHFITDLEKSEEIYLPRWVLFSLKKDRLEDVVDPKLEGMFEKAEARLLLQVALLCIQDHPSARPSMVQVVKMLEKNAGVPDLPLSLETQVMLHASNAASAIVESNSALQSPIHVFTSSEWSNRLVAR